MISWRSRIVSLGEMLRPFRNLSPSQRASSLQSIPRPILSPRQCSLTNLLCVKHRDASSHHNSFHHHSSGSFKCRLCPLHHTLLMKRKWSFISKSYNLVPFSVLQRTQGWKFTEKLRLFPNLMPSRQLESSNSEVCISFGNPDFREYVVDVLRRYQRAQESMARSDLTEKDRRRCSQTIINLAPAAMKVQEWVKVTEDLESIQRLYQEDQDKEMQELASSEIDDYQERREELQTQILGLLSPVQPADDNDVIVEFSAGVGGQEAMLFTADLFAMYQKLAAHMRWRFEVLEFDTTELGGLRHATASVAGHQAYKRFRYEAGVHRVQRIPKTEKSGRVHTSTMTVAVLPQPKQIDIKLESKDLRIETKKASGAGGQHVNTTDSAVRITHLPTGFVGECQQERSQLKNRQIAMKLLQAKIYAHQLDRQTQNERSLRKQQVGSSARSEKIRTYNYAQDRITDHRLGESIHGIEEFLSGGEMLSEMTDSLAQQDQREALVLDVEDFIRNRGGSNL